MGLTHPASLRTLDLFAARVVELADTLDLGSSAARRAGSTPAPSTILYSITSTNLTHIDCPMQTRGLTSDLSLFQSAGVKTAATVRLVFIFVCSLWVSAGELGAQDPSTLPTSQLQVETRDLVSSRDFVEALPYLLEMERRVSELPLATQGEALENIYLYLSIANLQKYALEQEESWLEETILYADKYIEKFPDGMRIGMVLVNKGDALRAMGDFAAAAEVLVRAMTPPEIGTIKLSMEPDILEKIVQAYYITQNWESGISWFLKLMEFRDFPDKTSLAATALVEAYIATDRVGEMMQFVPMLARDSDARYNVRLNAKLIEGADKLNDEGNYAQAAFLYNLVLSKNEMIDHHQMVYDRSQLEIRRIEDSGINSDKLSKLRIDSQNSKHQVEQLKEVEDYSASLQWRKAQTFQKTGRDYEAFWAFYRLLTDYPDNKAQIEDFHYAAFVQAREIELKEKVLELGESYVLNSDYREYRKEITFMLGEIYKSEGLFEQFRDLATQFVVNYPDDDFSGAMIYLLADAYSSAREYQRMADDFSEMIALMDSGKVMDGLYYWSGMAGIFLEDYDLSRQSFSQLFDQFETSAYLEDAEFRMGVVQFASGELDQALETMRSFLDSYPESVLRGEAHVYLGDLYAAMATSAEFVNKAIESYSKVPDYTDTLDFIDHAYFQSARLCEENQFYGRMVKVLNEYVERFPSSPSLSKAIFQMGKAYELEGQPVKGLLVYRDAIGKFGNYPLSFGVDEIIELYPIKYQRHYDRLQATYGFLTRLTSDDAFRAELLEDRRKLFAHLGDNPAIDGAVREMIMRDKEFRASLAEGSGKAFDLLDAFKRDLDGFPTEKPKDSFGAFLDKAKAESQETLKLRMQMALDAVSGIRTDASSFTSEDLDAASPSVMVWMARLIRESKDLALEGLAREALENVIANFRQDEAAHFDALIEYGMLEKTILNFDGAQAYFREAIERYPVDSGYTDAVVLLGDAYRAGGKHEEAVDTYELVLRDKKQYGKPVRAEVQYKIGLSYFERGMFAQSHAFFERVFLAFSGFKEWAARAYLKDAQALISMGSSQDAANTLKEAIKVANIRDTEAYPDIEVLYQTLITN